jgi:hypothetical protein
VINCPLDIVVPALSGQTSRVINYGSGGHVGYTENCGGATVICTPPSGSTFQIGTTTVNCTATDNNGNKSQCSFNVTVNSCATAPADLIAWWPGEGKPSTISSDAGALGTAYDIIGGHNTFVMQSVASVPGKVGAGFHFNGGASMMEVDDSCLRPDRITVEAWVNFDSLDTPNATVPGLQYIVFKENIH